MSFEHHHRDSLLWPTQNTSRSWRKGSKNGIPGGRAIRQSVPTSAGGDLSGADLNGAALALVNFTRADLSGTNLSGANLYGADLSGADLTTADLGGADLGGNAELSGANLSGADLSGADLSAADLSGAVLLQTNLSGAYLSGVNLSEAVLSETVFGDTNLKDVLGLDACMHFGPSILDHRTLAKSGTLPLSFLRGCGFSDEYIDYLPSLFNQAIQFYSCFISYSTKDQAFADRLYADLQNKGVRCWFAPHDMQGGKKLHEQIDEAIRVYDRLLLILSEASMNSEWVKTEIANARQKELGKGERVLFPISLVPFETIRRWKTFDADTGKDSNREIREYFIPDFTDWKNHDNYQHAFERLLKDLKAGEQ
jgi:TIR domain/Pentapeptide repeats (8 copies)